MIEELTPPLAIVFGLVIETRKQTFVTRQGIDFPKVVGEKVLTQSVDKLLAVAFFVRQDIQVLYCVFKVTPQSFKRQFDRTVKADIAAEGTPPNSFICLREKDFALLGGPIPIEGAKVPEVHPQQRLLRPG